MIDPKVLDRLEKLEKKATPKPWYSDHDGQRSADTVYVATYGPDDKILFDTSNSGVMLIHDESDEDGPHYWDETGKANLELVDALRNLSTTLIAEARAAAELTELLGEFMQLNAANEYEFESNEKSWYSRAHAILVSRRAAS